VQDALSRELGLAGPELDRAVHHYREYYGQYGLFEYEKIPRIDELLSDLRSDGFGIAVATSKPTVYAQSIVDRCGWASLMGAVHGSNLDGTQRHKAEVITQVLKALGQNDRPLALVGDRREDAIGAQQCGLPCIGVTWGFGSREELEAAGVVGVVSSVGALGPALYGLEVDKRAQSSQ
jgi:phosphoglycolate phosphatase